MKLCKGFHFIYSGEVLLSVRLSFLGAPLFTPSNCSVQSQSDLPNMKPQA